MSVRALTREGARPDRGDALEPTQHIRTLQLTYASQLADSVQQYENAGVLERITVERRTARLASGTAQVAQMGISYTPRRHPTVGE